MPERVVLRVEPMGKPRMTRADRWKKRPVVERYWSYADKLREELARAGVKNVAPGGQVVARFILPMPPSWGGRRRERMRGQPHTQRPDTDNLTKALLDIAMPEGDQKVWSLTAEKRWGDEGSVILWVERE